MTLVAWAVGAVVARFLDTEEVTGSNPVPPIRKHSNINVECFLFLFTELDLKYCPSVSTYYSIAEGQS